VLHLLRATLSSGTSNRILLHAPRFPNVVAPGSDFGTLAQSDRPDLAGPESSGYRLILCRPEEEARIRMKRFVDDHPDTDVLDFEISLGYDYWPAGTHTFSC
jgi:hypothetical protein